MKQQFTLIKICAVIVFGLINLQSTFAVTGAGATQVQTDLAVGQKYGIGTSNQKLLKMVITPTGSGDVITQFDLTLTGYAAMSRVAIYRGANPDFEGSATFGSVLNPATASVSVTGSYTYTAATAQTFWVIIDVSPTASTGVTLDARCTLITEIPVNLTPTAAANTKVVTTVDTPLSGNKTIKAGGDYATIKAASLDLNALGVAAAGVTFVLDDDATYTSSATDFTDQSLYIRPQGVTPGSITIKRSGTGTNKPIINYPGSAGAYEAVVGFFGYDNVTVDGLDIRNTNSAVQKLDYGIHFYGTTTDGCQNNVVKNCSMTSFIGNAVRITSTATSAGAVNKNNKIFNNYVANGSTTISFTGSPFEFSGVSATYPDENLEVYSNTISGIFANSADAIKATTINVMTGMLFTNCKDTKIHHNVLDGGTSTMHTNLSIIGITARVGMSGYLECYANTVKNITNTGTGIYNTDGITVKNFASVGGIYLGCADTKIYNNVIANLKAESSLSIGLGLYGFSIVANDGVSSNYQIYNNSVYLSQAGSSNVGDFITTINMSGASANTMSVTLNNNIFVNTCTTTNAKLYLIYSQASSVQKAAINTSSSNNLYYTTSGTTFMNIGSSTYASLAAYQTGIGAEANSISVMPPFISASDLHIVNTSTSGISNSGTPIALVTDDVDGNVRSLSTPDMGADEFELATAISQPNSNIQNVFLTMQNGDIVANLSELKGEVSISVYDTKGQNIKSILTVGGNSESLKLNKKGIYLVRIQNNNITSTNKVIL